MDRHVQSLESRRLMSAGNKMQISEVELLGLPAGYSPPPPAPVVADPWAGHTPSAQYTGTIVSRNAARAGTDTFSLKVYDDYADVLTLGQYQYPGETSVRNGRLSFRFFGGIPYTPDHSTTRAARLTLTAKFVTGKPAAGRLRAGWEDHVTRSTRNPLGATTTRSYIRWRMFNYAVRIQAAGVA
jgi:hypothetical protein